MGESVCYIDPRQGPTVPLDGEKFAITDGEDLDSHHYPNIKGILKDRAVQPTYFRY